ncbi:MAG: hypothetical protein ACYDDV_04455 [Methanoregula sp.]
MDQHFFIEELDIEGVSVMSNRSPPKPPVSRAHAHTGRQLHQTERYEQELRSTTATPSHSIYHSPIISIIE